MNGAAPHAVKASTNAERSAFYNPAGACLNPFAQRVDYVPVIDDVTALAVRDRLPPPERHHRRRAKEAVEPVVVEVHAQAMADQPRVDGRRSGYALPPSARPQRILILIDAALSS